jgi:hypothetical protein
MAIVEIGGGRVVDYRTTTTKYYAATSVMTPKMLKEKIQRHDD